ncbi:MAG: hypothetical protein L3J16_05890 [Anaerolineales bacterium]|nr:hypothetical protein [Anaerolineales bacterium]
MKRVILPVSLLLMAFPAYWAEIPATEAIVPTAENSVVPALSTRCNPIGLGQVDGIPKPVLNVWDTIRNR